MFHGEVHLGFVIELCFPTLANEVPVMDAENTGGNLPGVIHHLHPVAFIIIAENLPGPGGFPLSELLEVTGIEISEICNHLPAILQGFF